MLRSLSRAASTGAGARSSLPAPLSRLSRGIAMSSVSRAAAAMTVPEAASDPGAHLRGMKASTKAAKIVPTSPTVQDGRERSAIFGRYPTRKKINFKAGRERKFDPKAEWRLDPISVMNRTPYRRCCVTSERLRSAYMLNLRGLLIHDASGLPRVLATPDRLLHPRFAGKRSGAGTWISLRPDVVSHAKSAKRSIATVTGGSPKVNDRLVEQVGHELGERVAQELELLRARIRSAAPRQAREGWVLRPLSKTEEEAIGRGGAPDGAIAILDVRFGAKSKLTTTEREAKAQVPMLRQDGKPEADVPLFPLHAMLGVNPRPSALVEDVLAAERDFARRCAEAAGADVLDGAEEVESIRAEEGANYVAVYSRGGVELVVALWRVCLWRGEGWERVLAEEEEGEEGRESEESEEGGMGRQEGPEGEEERAEEAKTHADESTERPKPRPRGRPRKVKSD